MLVNKSTTMSVKIFRFLSFCLIVALISCKPSEDVPAGAEFSRTDMLKQTADSLIIPSMDRLQESLLALEVATDTFNYNKTETNILALQNAWKQTVRNWEYLAPFDFSPSKETTLDLNANLGTFPVDSSAVEAYTQGTMSDKRGFFAMEVLLFSSNKSASQIVSSFDQARINHLNWLIDQAKDKLDRAKTDWNANYLAFVSDNSNNAGSSITYLFNAWLSPTGGYECIKNFKVGQPMGLNICSNNGIPGVCSFGDNDYRRLEGFRSGISLELIKIHWTQVKKVWYGAPKGFQEYLETVSGGQQTITQTLEDMANVDAKLAAIPTDQTLAETIKEETTASPLVKNLFEALVKNTRNFKSELVSKLGMSLTYTSGDGD